MVYGDHRRRRRLLRFLLNCRPNLKCKATVSWNRTHRGGGRGCHSYRALKDQTEVLLQTRDYQFRKPGVILKLLLIQHCCVKQLIKVFLWASETDEQFQRFVQAANEKIDKH